MTFREWFKSYTGAEYEEYEGEFGSYHMEDAFKAGSEEAAKIVENGNFLHNGSPEAIFGRQAAAAIRRVV